MTTDIFAFLMMLIVTIMMYGVSTEALRPALIQDGDAISAWRLAYRPYFQIFGELYLDDIAGETECIGDTPFENCGSSLQVAIMLLSGKFCARVQLVQWCTLLLLLPFGSEGGDLRQDS